jgi:hypothetical protein
MAAMTATGTELPIPNVRSSVANGGKADKICSMRVLLILPEAVIGPPTEIPQHNSLLPYRGVLPFLSEAREA